MIEKYLENNKVYFEFSWCDYLTPCQYKEGVDVGSYDCSCCEFFSRMEITKDIFPPADYARYCAKGKGFVCCNKK